MQDTAVEALITELAAQNCAQVPKTVANAPNTSALQRMLNAHIHDAVQRVWSAVAVDAQVSFPVVPPRIPSRQWRRLGFQVRVRRTQQQHVRSGAAVDVGATHSNRTPCARDAKGVGCVAPALPASLLLLEYVRMCMGAYDAWALQSDDPTTDFRAFPLVTATYLARLCEEYPEARAIGANNADEVPLGISAINVFYMLRCHLLLMREVPSYCPCCGTHVREEYATRQPRNGRHLRGFANLLLEDPDTLFHVFAQTFLVTASLWRKTFPPTVAGTARADATVSGDERLMHFKELLHQAQVLVFDSLATFPTDLSALRTALVSQLVESSGDASAASAAWLRPVQAHEASTVFAPVSGMPRTGGGGMGYEDELMMSGRGSGGGGLSRPQPHSHRVIPGKDAPASSGTGFVLTSSTPYGLEEIPGAAGGFSRGASGQVANIGSYRSGTSAVLAARYGTGYAARNAAQTHTSFAQEVGVI
ncbi:hypothetical protein EON66_05840 [archaeon]|nr:MAG: hypothetical protein EON66_05840 [archaeon]